MLTKSIKTLDDGDEVAFSKCIGFYKKCSFISKFGKIRDPSSATAIKNYVEGAEIIPP
jgi:hypothetical protein